MSETIRFLVNFVNLRLTSTPTGYTKEYRLCFREPREQKANLIIKRIQPDGFVRDREDGLGSEDNHNDDKLSQAQEAVTRALEVIKKQFELSGQWLAEDLVDDLIERSKSLNRKVRFGVETVTPKANPDVNSPEKHTGADHE